MKNIYRCKPINKMAALVTSQAGCASDDTLSDEQVRENYVNKHVSLKSMLLTLPKKSAQRKEIGVEMYRIQEEINKLRPAKKAKGVEVHFISAAKEKLSPSLFNVIMNEAVEKLNNQ